MADPELCKLWVVVRQNFDGAQALLPSQPSEVTGSVARLAEWLNHNELELALDELESLGVDNAAPPAFWAHLRCAAELMGLVEYQARLTYLAATDAEPYVTADRGRM